MKFITVAVLLIIATKSYIDAAEVCPVLAVPAADRVVIKYMGLPVDVPLAYIDVPIEPAARAACQARLSELVKNHKVTVEYKAGFGTDSDGTARVHLLVGDDDVNLLLIAGGFARFVPGPHPEPAISEPLRKAQERAQADKTGMWSGQGAWAPVATAPAVASVPDQAAPAPAPEQGATTAAPTSAASTPAASPSPAASTPFCSEIDSTYYYPTGDPAVANVNPQRLIFYPDEASAQRAGKLARPQVEPASLTSDGSETSADTIFATGKELYAQAIAAGNTPERDKLYAQAFVVLTKAMQVYSKLCDAKPDDDALGEKLRVCMQLRYGSVKQRRFE